MMQVTSIIMTTPFSMSSDTRYWPGATSTFMPIITIAMAPAAWAEVSPNIMWPSTLRSRKMSAEK